MSDGQTPGVKLDINTQCSNDVRKLGTFSGAFAIGSQLGITVARTAKGILAALSHSRSTLNPKDGRKLRLFLVPFQYLLAIVAVNGAIVLVLPGTRLNVR